MTGVTIVKLPVGALGTARLDTEQSQGSWVISIFHPRLGLISLSQ